MRTANFNNSDDEWLIDVLTNKGSPLIECYGRYPGDPTDSWHAHWIPDRCTVDVEAEWKITKSGKMKKFDIKLSVSTDGDFSERSYHEVTPKTFDIKASGSWNPMTSRGTFTLTIDGVNTHYTDNGLSEVKNKIENEVKAKIKEYLPTGMSGYKDVWLMMGARKIEVDSSGDFDIDPNDLISVYASGPSTGTISGHRTIEVKALYTSQNQVYYRPFAAEQPNVITLSVRKTTDGCSSNLFNLPMYNLSNMYFELYTSEYGNTRVKDIDGHNAIIDGFSRSGGLSDEIELPAEYANKTIYFEEVLPSSAYGIKEPTERVEVRLPDAGESRTVSIDNEPIHDPVSIKIQKKSNISKDKWIGDPILNGIEYTLEYYTTKSAAISGTSPTTTWKFETDSVGYIDFRDNSQLKSGTPYTRNGRIIYPLGFYRVYESTSSTVLHNRGLERNEDIYYLEVHNDNDIGITTVYSDKFITEAGNVYNNNSRDATIYRADTVNTFGTIEKEHWEPFAFVKKDIYLTSGKPEGDASLEGATFRLYSEDKTRFYHDDKTYTDYDGNRYTINQTTGEVEVNGETYLLTIDSNGVCEYPYPLPKTEFNAGKRFYIKEISAPVGYQLATNTYYADYQTRKTITNYNGNTVNLRVKNMTTGVTSITNLIYSIRSNTTTISVNGVSTTDEPGTVPNSPVPGKIQIQKYDGDLSGKGETQGDTSLTGIKYAVINRSNKTVYYNNGSKLVNKNVTNEYNPGEIVAIKATNASGHVDFGYFSYGTYDIVELRMDNTLAPHMNYDNNSNHYGNSNLANKYYVYSEDKTVAEVGTKTTYNVDKRSTLVRNPDSDYTADFTNYAVKGTIVIKKEDIETVWAQGDEDFAGINFAIVNRSAKAIERFDKLYAPGEVVAIIVTDHDGYAYLDEKDMYTLPYGRYDIYELRKDATIVVGDNYDASSGKLGTSIYSNDYGILHIASAAFAATGSTNSANYTVDVQKESVSDLKRTYTHTFKNSPVKGTITITKNDANLTVDGNKEHLQGDATTEGIEYAIVNVSKDPQTDEGRKVRYRDVNYEYGHIIDIISIKAEYNYEARLDPIGTYSLNYGTYLIYELRVDHKLHQGDAYPINNPTADVLGTSIYSNNSGYLHNDNILLDTSNLVTVSGENSAVDYSQYEVTIINPEIRVQGNDYRYDYSNYPARGEIFIRKYDDETDLQKNQGNNHFIGIRYAIVNRSAVHVYYKETVFEPGEIIDIAELDDDGNAHLVDIPYGTYDIHELRRDSELVVGDIYPTSSSDVTWDKLGTSEYANRWYTYCDEIFTKMINLNHPVYTVKFYHELTRVAGETHEYKFSNVPIRSDFEHHKYDIDGNPMTFIPFSVSVLDDSGEIIETHIILSDANGDLNTKTRPRDLATLNSLDKYYDKEHGRYTGPLDETASEVNIWFGNIDDYYDLNVIADNRGSLLAGNYYIQELYCENNKGQDMLRHEFSAFEEGAVNKPRNIAIDLNIIMKSNAYDFGTHSKTLSVSKAAKIRDTVDITHLKIYNEYKIVTEAVNVRKDGSWVTLGFSEPYIFTPEQYDETMTTYGTYDIVGVFDTSTAEPGTYVGLIDRLYVRVDGEWTEEPIRIHNGDLTDENQMLLVPELTTHAVNLETGSLIGSIEPATAASDTIIYKNLGDRSFFNIEILVVNESGDIIDDVNGNPCKQNYFLYTNDMSATKVEKLNNVFVSPTSGEISMEDFSLSPFIVGNEYDTIGMIVNLYDAVTGELVLSHNTEMDEADEIIRYVKLHTHASNFSGQFGVLACSEEAELIDIISYENLIKDAEVTIVGAVIDKENGDIITTATKQYNLTEGSGEVTLSFVFDSSKYAGKEFVVFERVYLHYNDKDILISSHEDIEDTDQTVKVLDIHTTAVNPDTDTNILKGTKKEQTIIDKVEYHDLIVGQKYTLRGKLVVKPEDGSNKIKYVVNNKGEIIESSVTFVAETSNGIVEVPFVINPSKYAGKKLVVFERLYFTKDIETDENDNNKDDQDNTNDTPNEDGTPNEEDTPNTEDTLIAIHEDVNDEEQTLNVTLLLHVSIAKADFDDVGYFLKGAEITIFNEDDTVATDIWGDECIGITDENGSVDFVVLYNENNTYYAQETGAPEGYYLCEDKFEIHPTDDRENLGTDLIKINILDEIIVIPPTGDPITPIALAILGVSAPVLGTLVTIKVRKSKKEKNNKKNSD